MTVATAVGAAVGADVGVEVGAKVGDVGVGVNCASTVVARGTAPPAMNFQLSSSKLPST